MSLSQAQQRGKSSSKTPILESTSSIRRSFVSYLTGRYFRSGLYPAPKIPLTLGREGAGVVEEVGEGVTEFKKGDRVAFLGPEVIPCLLKSDDSHMLSILSLKHHIPFSFPRTSPVISPRVLWSVESPP
jgi:hypothetical protein